jgi:hypothetical protein
MTETNVEQIMDVLEIQESARKLYQAHGDKAEFEAAQKARHFKDVGNAEEAEDWKRIREVIAQMRGAHYS